MIPILLNYDVDGITGMVDDEGYIKFNRDIDFEIFDLIANCSFKCDKQTGKVLVKGEKAKLLNLTLSFRRHPDMVKK